MDGYSTINTAAQAMQAYSTYSHHFGSGLFSSLSPSHSCPVVSRPVTESFSILVGTAALSSTVVFERNVAIPFDARLASRPVGGEQDQR